MPVALYKKNGQFYRIKAVDVDPKKKDFMSFYCRYCKIRVIYVQGNQDEGSKPFFRKAPRKVHLEGCPFSKKKTLDDEKREIGTLDNLEYGIKPPLAVQRVSKDQDIISRGKNGSDSKRKNEKNPVETKVDSKKKHQRNISTVDDLFHEIKEIKNQDASIKRKLFNRLIGNIYYPYSEYELLLSHYNNDGLRRYFFTAGKVKVNEYTTIDEGYINLYGKLNNKVMIRLFPVEKMVESQLRNFTYDTRFKASKLTEFIGVKVSLKRVVKEGNKTLIELDLYEFDVNAYLDN